MLPGHHTRKWLGAKPRPWSCLSVRNVLIGRQPWDNRARGSGVMGAQLPAGITTQFRPMTIGEWTEHMRILWQAEQSRGQGHRRRTVRDDHSHVGQREIVQ